MCEGKWPKPADGLLISVRALAQAAELYKDLYQGATLSSSTAPPRLQRGLLCLGETPDARDSEALIGSIPPQRVQRLAALEVPEPDGPVIPATGQPAPIGTHLERLHGSLMRLSIPVPQTGFPHTLATLHLPPAQRTITAPTDQPLPTRTPDHRTG
jgi:hypothetical protein